MALFNRKKTEAPAPKVQNAPAASASDAVADKSVAKRKGTKKDAAATKEAPRRAARAVSPLALRTILAPLATEKTAHFADKGVYAFLVAKDANRVAVRQAFRELYNVTPVKVNIINVGGTTKRFGRFAGRTADTKKALVTLPKGTHINVFESV